MIKSFSIKRYFFDLFQMIFVISLFGMVGCQPVQPIKKATTKEKVVISNAKIDAVFPATGPTTGGTVLVVNGSGFSASDIITFGGSPCTNVVAYNSSNITCTTTSHATGELVSASIIGGNGIQNTTAGVFTYLAQPTITSVTPNVGFAAGGTSVTLTGTEFLSGATVDLGGAPCTSVNVISDTSLTCTTTSRAAGTVTANITNTDSQKGSLATAYTYQAAPTITSITPSAGALAGGTAITLTGADFVTGATVDLGGSACGTPTVVNSTTITCTTTAHIAGAVTATVTNPDTQSGNRATAYTYQGAPTLTNVTANAGALAGGTSVTLTGTGFVTGATVDFGGSACTTVNIVSSSSMTCTTPAHAAGAVTVTVTNADTQSGSLAAGYTYQGAPTVTNVTATTGFAVGGTAVTITGTNFATGATVDFGGSACGTVNVASATSITCTTTAHAAGAVTVTVTNTDSQSGNKSTAFTYVDAPTVTSVAANAGALAGGTAVTITGTAFVAGATVDFGGSTCITPTVVNSTTITCTTTAHAAGAVTVTVTNADTQSGSLATGYTYKAAPTVTNVAAATGFAVGGTAVTITGTEFSTGATVDFGGSACSTVNVVNSTTITCTTTAHAAGAVTVTVTNADTQSGNLPAGFTFVAAPTVTNVNLNAGAIGGGTAVTITGTAFVAGALVDFGGAACGSVNVVNSTTITCTTSAHAAGAVTVSVTNTDSQIGSLAAAYTYQPVPTISGASPSTGALAGGTTVTLTGTGFVTGATVDFGGSTCVSVNVISSTSLTCVTTAHALGAVTITVTNVDTQVGSQAIGFIYIEAPTVTNVVANAGALAGGTNVTITGTGFLAGATVDFGGSACGSVNIVSVTSLTCTTTAHAAGAVTVTVTNTDTQSGNLAAAFTYQTAPAITSLDITAGALAGGTNITITGTGFLAGATVDFGGAICDAINVVNETTITCTTILHDAGTVNVSVTNTDSQVGTLTNGYTYQAAPTVASVTRNAGTIDGGTTVAITGTGFKTGATVTFDGVPCTSVVVSLSTLLSCVTPVHAIGAVTVAVTNTDSQTGNLAAAFTYQNAPTLTNISPTSGFTSGATAITLTGTGFVAGATVTLSGYSCNGVNVVNDTTITCNTTAHPAGVVSVTVTNADTQTITLADAYTYVPPPVITSMTPNAGAIGGATTVTLTGTGFTAGATVTIGGLECTGPNVVSFTTLTCSTAAHAIGAVDVVVTNTDTQTGTLSNGYTYQVAPTVSSLDITAGALAGGTNVTITGTGFLAGATVDFDGSACGTVNVVSDTSITCTTTAHAAGAVTVTVSNTDNQSGNLAAGFTYQASPAVTSLDITAGALAGGTNVTITGTGFLAGATVDFGGSACGAVIVVNDTTITCTTIAHAAGTVDVSVTNTDTQVGSLANGYTYQAAPTVTSVTRNAGALGGGTAVTIAGTGFVTGATVDFGGSPCDTINIVSGTSLTCTTTAHAAGEVTVTVTNTDTQSGNLASAYSYLAAPTLTSITNFSGFSVGGNSVTLTGTGFRSGATVLFGGSPCISVNVSNDTTLTCTTTAHAAGAVDVTITNPDTQSVTSLTAFTYLDAPTVTSLDITAGALVGGTAITITGSNFIAGATVDFGGSACGGANVLNSTTITCTTTAHAAGAVTVTVTNLDTQTGTLNSAYTYQAAPTVTSLSVTGGSLAGGTVMTITGTGFLTGATVLFDAVPCTNVTVVSATSITCTTGAHAAGTINITVTNTDTQAGTLVSGFTYRDAPTVTILDPVEGTINGGTPITITGTGFITGASVDISGSTCNSVNVASATSITCTTTAHAAGLSTVTVTNTDNQSGNLANFTYKSFEDLKWVVGATSPTPPNPDDYGSTSTNITHTFTLKNFGDLTSSTITISKSGTNPGAWTFGTDNCSGAGNELAPGATCTVQVTFLGQFLVSGGYSAVLEATSSTSNTTNNISATKP